MKRLAIIPSDPLEEYKNQGLASKLTDYYNPLGFFDEIFALTPLEKNKHGEFGMNIIPTKDRELKSRLKEFNIDIVRAYGGNWPSDMACRFKLETVPVVVSVHDRRREWLHKSIRKADFIFVVSEEVKGLVESFGVKSERVWLLPNRIDFNIMRSFTEDQIKDLKEEI